MRIRLKTIGLLLGLIGMPLLAWAAIRPSFSLEECVKNATHIVVVTEGENIDGIVEVMESWKGDLKKGDSLNIPELAEFADKDSREINKRGEMTPTSLTHVSGDRMILFVKQQIIAGEKKWEAAVKWGGMQVSTAWIEDGKVYAFIQVVNPGDSVLVNYWLATEAELKARVDWPEGGTPVNCLQLTIRSDKKVYSLGTDKGIHIELRLRNVGKEAFSVLQGKNDRLWVSYFYEIDGPKGRIQPGSIWKDMQHRKPRKDDFVLLRSQEKYISKDIGSLNSRDKSFGFWISDIPKMATFVTWELTTPGVYKIKIQYKNEDERKDFGLKAWTGEVTSNTITIEIKE